MLLAVISDSHDHLYRVEQALPRLQQAQVVLHCGDICSPFTLKRLAEGLPRTPIHVVWGNNDGDRRMLAAVVSGHQHVHLHGEFAALEVGGLRIAMTHYPAIARAVAAGETFDLVCYGHDHIAREAHLGHGWLLNPGELAGVLTGRASFALVDTEARSVTWVDLP